MLSLPLASPLSTPPSQTFKTPTKTSPTDTPITPPNAAAKSLSTPPPPPQPPQPNSNANKQPYLLIPQLKSTLLLHRSISSKHLTTQTMASSLSRRFSLGSPPQPAATSSSPDLKQRVITCLNKLADRDTLAMATAELDAIARNLSHDSFATFLICIHNTDSSSKPPVRKQCVSLLALLSNSHGDVLAPFLSKMISTVQRRLRDPDSAVRSACVDAVAAMSSQITTPSFSSAFLKPLMDTLAMEQDSNSQIGSALCLAAAIDAAPDPDPVQLKRSLARLGKLAKSESFKAKAALLVLVGSIVGAGGASNRGVLDWLVPCVVEFLSSEDWAVRKAAAEALGKVASVERDLTAMYKASCLNVLESRRFDKVYCLPSSPIGCLVAEKG